MVSINLNFLIVIGIIVGIIIVIIVLRGLYKKIKGMFRSRGLYGLSRENIKKRWQEIESLIDRNDEMGYKMAVMEADKLLDHVLKAMMISGQDMGQRLKVINAKYPETRQAWFGHKIRNQLVHEASYHLNYKTAKQAINSFRNSLKALGVL